MTDLTSRLLDDTHHELDRLEAIDDPQRRMSEFLLLSLEREQVAAIAYSESLLIHRLSELDVPDDVRELLRRVILWVQRDEALHALYLRGLLVRHQTSTSRAFVFIRQLIGSISGWVSAMRHHRPPARFGGRHLIAAAAIGAGRILGRIPDGLGPELQYSTFRHYCEVNIALELSAVVSYERLLPWLEDPAEIEAFERILTDEVRHADVFEILVDVFDENDRLRPGVNLAGLVERIGAVSPWFLPGDLRPNSELGSFGKGSPVHVSAGDGPGADPLTALDDARVGYGEPDLLPPLGQWTVVHPRIRHRSVPGDRRPSAWRSCVSRRRSTAVRTPPAGLNDLSTSPVPVDGSVVLVQRSIRHDRGGNAPMPNMTSWAETRAGFALDIPTEFNFVGDVMHARAAAAPDKVALIAIESDGTTINRYTFGDLADLSHRTAHMLRAHGVGVGDKVFVQVPRIVEFYAALLGCFQIGAVPMPGTTQLMSKDQQYRINRADAVAVVCDEDAAERFDEVRSECPSVTAAFVVGEARDGWTSFGDGLDAAGDQPAEVAPTMSYDPLLLYFTSGTTGGPKMVQHVGAYALGHEITARFWHDLTPDDIHWTVSDTGWAKAAWGKLFGQWIVGSAIVMWNIVGKPDFDRMLRLLGELGVTSFCAPPTLYRAFAQMDLSAYDWSTLRHCTSAGEPLNPEVIATWSEATGTTPYDGYGQTETVVLVANYPSEPVKPGSMGLPAPGVEVDVVDDDGNRCADGVEGNICVSTEPRPIGLFSGYWKDDERTAEVFRHGWYYTGDRAYRDGDGYLWFVGRADDVILSAAYRIGPFEVESSLIEHPAVAETAVVGKPDPDRGNIVKAYVILAEGFTASDELTAEIQEHVKTTTAPYKYPREIEYVTELPKTISGKIRRVELRERDA